MTLNEGFNLVAPQLDYDGTGTNNTVPTVFGSGLPLATTIYVFNLGTGKFDQETWNKNKAGTLTNWVSSTGVDLVLNPGQGCWVDVVAGAFGGGTGTVTITGNVLQGSLVNPNIPALGGFTLVGSEVPLSGGVGTALAYTPQLNDVIYIWDKSITNYDQYTYAKNKAGTLTNWNSSFGFGVEPALQVGQGFWLDSANGAAWSNNFTVQ